MTKRKPLFWIIKRDSDGRVLKENGCWTMHTDPANIKRYKTAGWASRRMMKLNPHGQTTAHAVYPGDILNAAGNIEKVN